MIVIHRSEEIRGGCVATMGKFDGLHLGHQRILDQVKREAASLRLPSLVILMEPHPEELFAPSLRQCPARLSNVAEKLRFLAAYGIDYAWQLPFDAEFSRRSADDFIGETLVRRLAVRSLVVGKDFRFGRNRQGDFPLLQQRGAALGFAVHAAADCRVHDRRVSSTGLRDCLRQGDFALAEQLLGRPYEMSGEVIEGRRLGASLGFPTGNIDPQRRRLPLQGVFACQVRLPPERLAGGTGDASAADTDSGAIGSGKASAVETGERLLPAAVNIGYRPTVEEDGKALLEAHVLDFDGDLYGALVHVIFRAKIRDERKFADLASLRIQLAADVKAVRQALGTP